MKDSFSPQLWSAITRTCENLGGWPTFGFCRHHNLMPAAPFSAFFVLCEKLGRAISKARRDGRISEFPKNEHLPPERRNNIFRILFVGYFKQGPWQLETRFLHDDQDRVRFVVESAEPRETTSAIAGSEIVANGMYRDHDPRFARYVKPRIADTLDWAADYVRGYIEACSDPAALELDPLCRRIGGHVHIAEITPSGGFKWRVAPVPPPI